MIGSFEAQAADCDEVQCRQVRQPKALGHAESVGDGDSHVGNAELREPGAVAELDEGVHDALRVDHDVDLRRVQVEQPARLDHFKALVQQRRRVDSDLVGPGSCQHNPPHGLARLAGQALMDRHMLRVERKDRGPGTARLLQDELAGGDEHLLVCERHLRAAVERRNDRLQAQTADQGSDHQVARLRGHLDQPFRAEHHPDLRVAERVL